MFPFSCSRLKLKQSGNFSGALTEACLELALLPVIVRDILTQDTQTK